MNLRCQHVGFNVSDIKAAKDFYANKLELEVIDDGGDNFFAVKSGNVRLSFFSGATKYQLNDDAAGMSLILRTDNILETRNNIIEKGIKLSMDITEAPKFMKFISFEDPDGNPVYIAQYIREPV